MQPGRVTLMRTSGLGEADSSDPDDGGEGAEASESEANDDWVPWLHIYVYISCAIDTSWGRDR